MDHNALIEGDVTDYSLAAKRIAAFRPIDQQIIDALDDDGVLAHADKFANRLHAGL